MPQSSSNSRLYWKLHTSGWLIHGLVVFVSLAAFNIVGASIAKIAAMSLFGAIQLFVLTHLLRVVAKRRGWLQLGYGKLIALLFASTLLLATFSQLSASVVAIWVLNIYSFEDYNLFYLALNTFQVEVWIVLWTLIYLCVLYFRNYKSEEIERWRLHAAVKDAELIALKAQITPHFIFNCLNNIRALVLEDSERARDAITRLSELLRYSIRFNQCEKVSIAQELEIVRDYLSLESIQMEDRLRYQLDAPQETLDALIPPMTIQLLVENAIKHGISTLPDGGDIRIQTKIEGTRLSIEVLNTGQLKEKSSESTGVGLQNAKDRLRLLFGANASLTLQNDPDNQVSARIAIPI